MREPKWGQWSTSSHSVTRFTPAWYSRVGVSNSTIFTPTGGYTTGLFGTTRKVVWGMNLASTSQTSHVLRQAGRVTPPFTGTPASSSIEMVAAYLNSYRVLLLLTSQGGAVAWAWRGGVSVPCVEVQLGEVAHDGVALRGVEAGRRQGVYGRVHPERAVLLAVDLAPHT